MATVVLHPNDRFPAATVVSAYLLPPGVPMPSGVAPPGALGAAVTTATVAADGSLTFTGLADLTKHVAYAQVGGKDTYVAFTTPALSTVGTHVLAVERTFTETTGAGVYTATVDIPEGATIHDIVVNGVALWDTTTSATLKVGDAATDNGYYTAVNLKATDLLAGESISFDQAGGKAGAYIANSQVSPRYAATARQVKGIVTTVGAAGSAGRTRMTVVYSRPSSDNTIAAAKV